MRLPSGEGTLIQVNSGNVLYHKRYKDEVYYDNIPVRV